MKKLFVIILLAIFLPHSVLAASRDFQKAPYTIAVGISDIGAATSFLIDSALVYGTSGDSWALMHHIRETLSTETLTLSVYCTADTGSPTSTTAYIYFEAGNTEDPDRPDTGGTAQYTSDAIDATGCDTPEWLTYTFTSVSATVGDTFWFLLANTTADPATNSFSVETRGFWDGTMSTASSYAAGAPSGHGGFDNINGWTADGTGRNISTSVVTYPSGNDYGFPYVTAGTHAADTNYRGSRFTPTEDMEVTAITFGAADTNFITFHIHQGSTEVLAVTVDEQQQLRGIGTSFAPITLTGGLPYDFTQKAGVNDTFSTIGTMGNSPPANVQGAAAMLTYVDGATPGSFTNIATQSYGLFFEVSDLPAISGGGTNAQQGIGISY